MIFAAKWILPGYSTHLHDLVASFGSEFGARLALLGQIEYLVLFPNLQKRISLYNYVTKFM